MYRLRRFARFAKKLLARLAGPSAALWWRGIERFVLQEDGPWVGLPPTWRVVRIGGRTAAERLEVLREAGIPVSKMAVDAARKIACVKRPAEYDLVLASGGNLGLEIGSYQDLLDRAAAFGFYPPPPETALALRAAVRDQPVYTRYVVPMAKPVEVSDGGMDVFTLCHDSLADETGGVALIASLGTKTVTVGHAVGSQVYVWCRRPADAS